MVAFTSQADWFKLAMVVVPVGWMVNILTPVEEAAISAGLLPAVPTTTNLAAGVVVEIPTLPAAVILNIEEPEEEEASNKGKIDWVEVPKTVSRATGAVVLIPKLPVEVITKRVVLAFCKLRKLPLKLPVPFPKFISRPLPVKAEVS